jgi:hypothetical protein
MRATNDKRQKRWPSLLDKLGLWLSESGERVDGLWIGAWETKATGEAALRRVKEALLLIKSNDRLRYDRLIRDLERVWVRVLPGALGSFNEGLNMCVLDSRFVLAETSSLEVIASTIVHEATHARLSRCGIRYEQTLRPRVEAACFRRELAFAAKLPHGEQVREHAQRYLEWCTSDDYWTDAAFHERHVEGGINALRHLGTPDWLVRFFAFWMSRRKGKEQARST